MTTKFKSAYTFEDKGLTAHQRLAEIMVERLAASEQQTLPPRFWQNKDGRWAKEWKKQAIIAARLLKKFDAEAILKALRTQKGQKVWSLGAKWLLPLIETEQKKIQAYKERIEKEVTPICEPSTLPPQSTPFIPGESLARRLQ